MADHFPDYTKKVDYISREASIERFCNVYCGCSPEECGFKIQQDGAEECAAVRALKETPAADVRPVVLCRDCRWWTKQEKSLQGRCELAGFYPTGEWFCANGERPNCGEDMREPNLDTTKGDTHD